MTRALALVSALWLAACSVVVDDTLATKPSQVVSGPGGGGGDGGHGGDLGMGAQGGQGAAGGFDATGGMGGQGGTPVVCQLADDFDDGVIDPMWDEFTTASSGVTLTETSGAMQVQIPAGSSNRWGRVRTVDLHTGVCGLSVEVAPVGGDPDGLELVYAELNQDETYRAGFHLAGPTLEYWKQTNGTSGVVSSDLYDPAIHRWWRIRRDGGDLVWETSNGTGWVEQAREASLLDPSQAEVTLGAGIQVGPDTNGLTVRFDNLNINAP